MTERTHFVYRCYDAAGALLYVGRTSRPERRATEHRIGSAWASRVASVRMVGPLLVTTAARMEREAQIDEHPLFGRTPRRVPRGWRAGTRMRIMPGQLAVLMEIRGLTVRELAKAAGCSHPMVGHLRSGKRATCSESVANAISAALDVPAELIFTRASNGRAA